MTVFLFIVIGIIIFIVLNVVLGIVLTFHFRKCPYCGKRMSYQYKRTEPDGSVKEYVFHCNHCGAFENVTPIEMLREEHDTK
jgi:hypothetical protein